MSDLTQFDLGSAQRIARVVRTVEQQGRPGKPLSFDRADVLARAKAFKIGRFDGAWSIGSSKSVRIGQTTTTVTVQNLFYPIDNTAASNMSCAFAKDGTGWYLIDIPLESREGTFVTGATPRNYVASTAMIQVVQGTYKDSVCVGVAVQAKLNTTNCTIDVFTTNYTAQHTFAVNAVQVVGVGSLASGLFVNGTMKANYLTIRY